MKKWFYRGTCYVKVFLLLFFTLSFIVIFIIKKMFHKVLHPSHQVRYYHFFIAEIIVESEFDTDVKGK